MKPGDKGGKRSLTDHINTRLLKPRDVCKKLKKSNAYELEIDQ